MITVVGLSHRTAPIEVRELLALSPDALPDLLRALVQTGPIGEAFVVSTCNRVEVVAVPRSPGQLEEAAQCIRAILVEHAPGVEAHLYVHVGIQAVRHLFRVAASLDSLVIGEPQILGQIKQAFDSARALGTVGPALHRVVPRAIRSAKRVRTETQIGAGQVSVPSVAVDLASQIFGDLSSRTAALVGSGEMGETVARLLRQAGARLIVTGRNPARVEAIAARMNGEGRDFAAFDRTLAEADVVVTMTSAHHAIVKREQIAKNRRSRKGRNLFLIDLAVPRDVEPSVGELDGVFLYNIDDLSNVVAESLSSRRREAERADAIVEAETAGYDRWAETQQVTPTIVALRERIRGAFNAELQRSLGSKLKHLRPEDEESLARMVEAALKKIMHRPTVKLRTLATDPAARSELEQYLGILQELFELDAVTAEEPEASDSSPDASNDDESRVVAVSDDQTPRQGAR